MRNLVECTLCPCKFGTQADLDAHMAGFTGDPVVHIRKYIRGMSYPKKAKRERGQELYDKYLTKRGIKLRSRSKKARRKAPSPEQIQTKYASKIALFRHNYCDPHKNTNEPPSKPPLPGSWLTEKMEKANR